MFVQWRPVIFGLIFHECVYKTTCGFNIEFLQNCDNQQIQFTECPESFVTSIIMNPHRGLERPTFNVGSSWHNYTQLIGNASFQLGRKRKVRMIELDLRINGAVEDRRCLHVTQPLVNQHLSLNCLRMVPNNYAELNVRLYQYTRACRNQTERKCNARLFQKSSYSFKIGQESCRYYNEMIAVRAARKFTGWKNDRYPTVDFQYFDSSVNVYACVTEILISELCPDYPYLIYNKTLERGVNRIQMRETFQMKCLSDEQPEIIAETCSYCQDIHEYAACFHQEIQWKEHPVTRSPCRVCSIHADCVDGHCLCRSDHVGDGQSCIQKKEDHFPKEVVYGAIVGTICIVTIIVIIKWLKAQKVTCTKFKKAIRTNEHFHQQDTLLLNNQTSITNISSGKILLLYHPDTDSHTLHITTLYHRLRELGLPVVGLPTDYQSNWTNFVGHTVRSVNDVVIILSSDLCELCDLYIKQHNRTIAETLRWTVLMEKRQYDCVPCLAIEHLQNIYQSGSENVPIIHLVNFNKSIGLNQKQSARDKNLIDLLVTRFDFIKQEYHSGKVNNVTISVSDLMSDNEALSQLVSRFKTARSASSV